MYATTTACPCVGKRTPLCSFGGGTVCIVGQAGYNYGVPALAMHGMEDEETPIYTASDLKVLLS